ncbi:MAG: hypothetical protein J5636_11540 [Clostridiales bacterium]|nr:hypothetical protein [Clostridiales bacterium]
MGCFLVALGLLLFFSFSQLRLADRIAHIKYTKVSSPEDLQAMRDDPSGKYVLTKDIDMSGQSWTPFTFSGVLDGNGYTISNLSITGAGSAVRDTYDGNMKKYETGFTGFFDSLEGGQVRNLTFSNIEVTAESDTPFFAGTIAGYMDQATISDCKVDGSVMLRAHDRMFGVGGLVGYGNGRIENIEITITLVCIDTDRETKDEQFMGGICGAGYPDLLSCYVEIDGYASEHGYAHNGGVLGMYEFYPEGISHEGICKDNVVFGKITFFEDNEDRRAYCEPIVGETVDSITTFDGNGESFQRDEVFNYDVDLLPQK